MCTSKACTLRAHPPTPRLRRSKPKTQSLSALCLLAIAYISSRFARISSSMHMFFSIFHPGGASRSRALPDPAREICLSYPCGQNAIIIPHPPAGFKRETRFLEVSGASAQFPHMLTASANGITETTRSTETGRLIWRFCSAHRINCLFKTITYGFRQDYRISQDCFESKNPVNPDNPVILSKKSSMSPILPSVLPPAGNR